MFLRRFTDFVLQGRVQAMTTAFLFAYVPFLGIVSILIAALVTLRKNTLEGFWVTCAATFPYFLMYAVHPAPNEVPVLAIFVIGNILTWLFAIALKKYSNWSLVLDISLMLGVIAVVATHLFYPEIQAAWATYINQNMDMVNKQFQLEPSQAQQDAVADFANDVKQYATGALATFILLNTLLQLVIARWWQALMFNPGGLRKELCQIRLSYIAGVVFVVDMLLSYLKNGIAIDSLPVVYAIFFLAGSSLLMSIFRNVKWVWMWMTLVLTGVVILVPFGTVIVAMIALLDVGLDLRKRFSI